MAEDAGITKLRAYRRQLVAIKGNISAHADSLANSWKMDDKETRVCAYLRSISDEINTAISNLDTDIAMLNQMLNKAKKG